MNKKIQIIVGAIILVLIGWFFVNQASEPMANEPVKIGAILPLTGNLAFLGDDYKNSLEMAVSEINSKKGINGRNLEIFFEDGMADPEASLSAAKFLVDVQDVSIIITAFRGASMAISSGLANDDILVFANTATSKKGPIGTKKFFPIGAEMFSAGGVVSKYIVNNNLCSSLSLISENTDAGRDKLAGVKDNFSNILSEEYVDPSETDYKTVLLKSSSADCLFFELRNKNTPILLKQIEELGLDIKLFSNSYSITKEVAEVSSNAEGLIFSSNRFSPETNSISKHYIEKYQDKFNEFPSEFGAALYDSIYLIKEAFSSCKEINNTCLSESIQKIKSREGVLGDEIISDTGDIFLSDYQIQQVQQKEFILID